ncbi:MAG: hypothetical protein N3G21_04055 [Candidatus Hydrogenedentes bacterium]|nr:hypothetical protein [Candidatus Hydrogenedentota bacterium]
MKTRIAIVLVLCCLFFHEICTTEEKLSPNNYPDWFEQTIQPLIQMQKEEALKPFSMITQEIDTKQQKKKKSKKKSDKNLLLLQMEGGRIARIVGDYDISSNLFSNAIDTIKQQEMGAVVSVSKTAKKTASVVAGESINEYSVKCFEKVMVYTQQALNYMSKNNMESAMVEVRNANQEQKNALEKYAKALEKELEELEKEAQKGKDKINYNEIIQTNYAGLDELVGKAKDSFQNAYSFYICGLISEAYSLRGGGSGMDLNDAYISYKDALEINPENRFIQRDVIRLAKLLGMQDDLKALLQRFPEHNSFAESVNLNSENGHLIVLYNDGLVPRLHQIDIPIPTPGGVLTLSFPTYLKEDKKDPMFLDISINGENKGSTDVICDLTSLSAKSLKERLPGMIMREFLRTAVMGVAQHEISKKGGIFGSVGSLMVTAIDKEISKADLRGYYSLPYYVHCFRTEIAPGNYKVTLSPSGASVDVDVEIKPKSINIIEVTRIESSLYTNLISL